MSTTFELLQNMDAALRITLKCQKDTHDFAASEERKGTGRDPIEQARHVGHLAGQCEAIKYVLEEVENCLRFGKIGDDKARKAGQ